MTHMSIACVNSRHPGCRYPHCTCRCHTPADPGIDETARDNDAEALADLGDVGDLRWDV